MVDRKNVGGDRQNSVSGRCYLCSLDKSLYRKMSFAYQKAANVIQDFWNKKASLKTLVYGCDFPKKVME